MPQHPYYEPTNEFIERHRLHIDEAERFCELRNHEDVMQASKSLIYNKDEGSITLIRGNDAEYTYLFEGFLPDEAALESVIAWTKWAE